MKKFHYSFFLRFISPIYKILLTMFCFLLIFIFHLNFTILLNNTLYLLILIFFHFIYNKYIILNKLSLNYNLIIIILINFFNFIKKFAILCLFQPNRTYHSHNSKTTHYNHWAYSSVHSSLFYERGRETS